jgi:EAL domain-containing protein (putative c-di-GMP-specific phosphodiesterase class I)
MLLAAIAAFVPLFAVDFLLDTYVRSLETAKLQRHADHLSANIESTATDTLRALRTLLATNSSLCTPGFLAAAHDLMVGSLTLRQILVRNQDDVQYCDGLGRDVKFTPLSGVLPLPGREETLRLGQLATLGVPAVEVATQVSDRRVLAAFAPLLTEASDNLAGGLDTGTRVDVSLTDGTEVLSAGDPTTAIDGKGSAVLTAIAVAADLPIRVTVAVPFDVVRADYADLDASFTVITSLMCGALLLLALLLVRRSDLPPFELERAIAKGEIKPYYQPVINMRTGVLAGCEVLCRWEKASGDVIPPGMFIDVAEATGLAVPMTLSLMQQLRTDLEEICAEQADLKISINLFEGHFRDSNIVEDVHTLFEGSAISFRQLVFEITERHPLDKHPRANAVIAGLHALGCRLAMDDVGTGHSNLSYMQTLGVDIIKIDRIFVQMIRPGVQQVPVLDGLITMARELGTEIVAEGVETEDQANYLRPCRRPPSGSWRRRSTRSAPPSCSSPTSAISSSKTVPTRHRSRRIRIKSPPPDPPRGFLTGAASKARHLVALTQFLQERGPWRRM